MKRIKLALFNSPDYFYTIPLEGVLYKIRIYYNERMKWWMIDLRKANNDPIVLGQRLSPLYPLFENYNIEGMTGWFFLSPKGKYKNETISNPLSIHKYYNFYYYF